MTAMTAIATQDASRDEAILRAATAYLAALERRKGRTS